MSYLKICFFIEFIQLLLYYINTNFCFKLIFVIYKFILLFKSFLLINYYKFNKNLLLRNFLTNKKFLYFTSKIINKILNIKVTSKTTKNTIIRKFSVISIIGNKTNWIGMGVAKHKKLSTAVKNSYIKAFKHIIYCNKNNFLLQYFKLKFKKTQLIIHNYNFKKNNSINLNNIFNLLGCGFSSKIIGVSSNLNNLLYIIKNLSNITLF